MDNCMINVKKNLIAIPVDPLLTCGSILTGKHNGIKVEITPHQYAGRINAHPTYTNFLFMAGIIHCSLKIVGRQPRNMYSVMYAFM
jgi:ribosomal protein S5